MSNLSRRTTLGALAITVLLAFPAGPVAGQASGTDGGVRNVVLLIADGAGAAHWSLARRARGDRLAVGSMPVTGSVETLNVVGGITDSGAAATALATGRRTYNRGISVAPGCGDAGAGTPAGSADEPGGCRPLETVLERARRSGKATGLVTTARVTDATPAAFAAHVPGRSMHAEIARQMLAAGVDVILGGGRNAFDGADGPDLLRFACRQADCPATGAALRALPRSGRRLLGLFAARDLPRAGERDPGLVALTRVALDRLSRDPDGFFLLVETEGTDTYSHDHEDAAALTREIVEFDDAVRAALSFARRTPGTLVVVTSDHETGGLSVEERDGRPVARWTTRGHTAQRVPLFAEGPGSAELAGDRDNAEVGRILMRLLGPSGGRP